MSLRGGDIATITEVRVSKRRIELLLDRGGLSTTELMRASATAIPRTLSGYRPT
jgi:hypothetical protein